MIAVNEKPLVISRMNEKDNFVFRKDSAGLGVPRSTFGKLDHISAGVAQHGSVEKTATVVSSFGGRPEGGPAANHGGNATHTMPASGQSSMSTHTSTSSRSSASTGQAVSSGSFGGAAPSMGSSMGGAHSASGGGAHH
jgi:hypothetical protein